MIELSNEQIDQVSGADYADVQIVAAGAMAGAFMGTMAGPGGALIGGAVGAIYGFGVAYAMFHM